MSRLIITLLLPSTALAAPFLIPAPTHLTTDHIYASALEDLDLDGDLDILLGGVASTRVYRNDGTGGFTQVTTFGRGGAWGYATADFDGDGDTDVWPCYLNGGNEVWFNDGHGTFVRSTQMIPSTNQCWQGHAGDLDGDGDVDVHLTERGGNQVWFNDGAGLFTLHQSYGAPLDFVGAGLGDLDGDGDVDLFTNSNAGSSVYVNDGIGNFALAQSLIYDHSYRLALGDVDGDGDLDALSAVGQGGPNKLWINDGAAFFTDSGQSVGTDYGRTATLADFDTDGDLDALIGNIDTYESVWVNDGAGALQGAEPVGDVGETFTASAGDLDGDGLPDMLLGGGVDATPRVWFNDGTLTALPTGPTLTRVGTCPGMVTLTFSNATAGGQLAGVSSPLLGALTIPTGPCAGTSMGLAPPATLRVRTGIPAGGTWTRTFSLPAGACGLHVQFVDLVTCGTSQVVEL